MNFHLKQCFPSTSSSFPKKNFSTMSKKSSRSKKKRRSDSLAWFISSESNEIERSEDYGFTLHIKLDDYVCWQYHHTFIREVHFWLMSSNKGTTKAASSLVRCLKNKFLASHEIRHSLERERKKLLIIRFSYEPCL